MHRIRLPSSIVVATYIAHRATELRLATLVRALAAELPGLDEVVAAQGALEQLYAEGVLEGEGRGPLHVAALNLSHRAAAPVAAWISAWRDPSARSVVLAAFQARNSRTVDRFCLLQALSELVPDFRETVDPLLSRPIFAALEDFYTEGLLRGEGRRPWDMVELVQELERSLGPTEQGPLLFEETPGSCDEGGDEASVVFPMEISEHLPWRRDGGT